MLGLHKDFVLLGKRGRDTKIPQSGGPPIKVGDEVVYKELGDRMERAATAASSFEAEQDSVPRNNIRDVDAQTRFEAASKSPMTHLSQESTHLEVGRTETANARTSANGEVELIATIDGQVMTITEASLRRHLKLEDNGGITTLPNSEIFEQLALMGNLRTHTSFDVTQDLSQSIKQAKGDSLQPHTRTYPTPILTQKVFSNMKRDFSKEELNPTLPDQTEEAVPMPHESPLHSVHLLGRDEGSLSLNELTDLYTSLSKKVAGLESELKQTKQTYSTALTKLILRVKTLEQIMKASKSRRRARVVESDDEEDLEDPSRQRRKITEINQDPPISLVQDEGTSWIQEQEKISDDTEVVLEEEEPTELVDDQGSGEKGEKEFSTVGAEHSTVILEVSTTAANLLDEREEVVAEADEPTQAQKIDWSDPAVLRYHAQLNKPYSIAEVRKNMVMYLKNQGGYKMNYFKGMKYEDIRPIFEKVWDQIHSFALIDSEKEKGSEKKGSRKKSLARERAGEKQSEESINRQKIEDDLEKEEIKAYLDLVPREELAMEIESLATKYPIVDWKTHVLTENFMYYQIIRADGSSKNYKIFNEMLDDFDRHDVLDLHRLVKARYMTSSPEGYDLMLWGDLKTLFEPDKEDEVWRNHQGYNLISWRLFDSCGIHILLMDNGIAIHMMIEKKYPLTQEMLSKMLSRKL
ncbi:hypothetical protein Tco_1321031 [Tanacetum coccineum]